MDNPDALSQNTHIYILNLQLKITLFWDEVAVFSKVVGDHYTPPVQVDRTRDIFLDWLSDGGDS